MAGLTDQLNQSNYTAPSLEKKKSLSDQLKKAPTGSIPSAAAPRPPAPAVAPVSSTEEIGQGLPSPEQVKDRKRISDAVNKNEVRSIYETESKQLFTPEEQHIHTAFLSELENQRAEAEKQYKAGKKQNEWMEVAETIGHALTQFGAGMYGQKHGVDMSGLKFDKADWQSKLVNLGKDLDRKTNELTGKRKEATNKRNKETSERQRLLDKLFASKQRDLSDEESKAFRTSERESGQDFRAGESAKDRAFRRDEQFKRLAAQKEKANKPGAFKPGEEAKIDYSDAKQERNLVSKENRVLEEIQKELTDGASPKDILEKYKKSEHLPMLQTALEKAPDRKGWTSFLGADSEGEKKSVIDAIQAQIKENKDNSQQLKKRMIQLRTSPQSPSPKQVSPIQAWVDNQSPSNKQKLMQATPEQQQAAYDEAHQ